MECTDFYATIGSKVFKNNYWDNTEWNEDGTPNLEGKANRFKIKQLVIGFFYEKPIHAIAKSINCTEEDTQQLMRDFYNDFPQAKQLIKSNHNYVNEQFMKRVNTLARTV